MFGSGLSGLERRNAMPPAKNKKELSDLMAALDEEAVYAQVQKQLDDGVKPLVIIEHCHAGMVKVGELYEAGEYFISGLIMAGEIMRNVGEKVLPLMENKVTNGDAGRIVLGTVAGDIHFIGKDIFKVLVQGYGFAVYDLGVDASPGKFLEAIETVKPDIVGLCCLISSAYRPMAETITFLNKNVAAESAPRSYIIGGRVSSRVCKEVGADSWADDGMRGVRLCQQIMDTGKTI